MSFYDLIQENVRNSFNVRDDFKTLTEDQIFKAAQTDRLDFAVCAMNVEGDLNVGMIIRTAHLLGARECVIYGRRRVDRRSFVGADKYTTLTYVDGLDASGNIDAVKFIDWIDTTSYFPVFIEHGGSPLQDSVLRIQSRAVVTQKRPMFVFGNEGTGIPTELLTADAMIISVPQRGVLRSFNVAATASIVMWEYARTL